MRRWHHDDTPADNLNVWHHLDDKTDQKNDAQAKTGRRFAGSRSHQLVADGLIASFTLTSSRLAASTITGSPYTSGTQRGGRVPEGVVAKDKRGPVAELRVHALQLRDRATIRAAQAKRLFSGWQLAAEELEG